MVDIKTITISPYTSVTMLTTALAFPGGAVHTRTNVGLLLHGTIGANFVLGYNFRGTGTAAFFLEYVDRNAVLASHFLTHVHTVAAGGNGVVMFDHPIPVKHGFGGASWDLFSDLVEGNIDPAIDHVTLFLGDQ